MSGLVNLVQMVFRCLTGYERRQHRRAEEAMKARLHEELSKPTPSMNAAGLELDMAAIQAGRNPGDCPQHGSRCGDGCMARHTIRRDCAFCGRERSPADDNHADDCPYWSVGPGRFDS